MIVGNLGQHFLQFADRDCWTLGRLWNHGLISRYEGFGTAWSLPSAFWIASRIPIGLIGNTARAECRAASILSGYEERTADRGVMMKDEASYHCDSCGEGIVVPIDLSAGSNEEYVEDCPVCCCPNVIHVEIDDDGEVREWAERE